MPSLWDMHVHLDFAANPLAVLREADELGLGMFACTVTPDGYERMQGLLDGSRNARLAAGLHPWWVADGRCGPSDIERAAALVRNTRFVGEIGLDFSPKHVPEGSRDVQIAAFKTIARACAETSDPSSPKILSIHSVRAAGDALDILEGSGCLARCHCIFHWFSGSGDELHRAVQTGCYFSINEMMLRTRRGREYARQLPTERLLLETDLPEEGAAITAKDIQASLLRTLDQLCALRGKDMQEGISETSQRLIG